MGPTAKGATSVSAQRVSGSVRGRMSHVRSFSGSVDAWLNCALFTRVAIVSEAMTACTFTFKRARHWQGNELRCAFAGYLSPLRDAWARHLPKETLDKLRYFDPGVPATASLRRPLKFRSAVEHRGFEPRTPCLPGTGRGPFSLFIGTISRSGGVLSLPSRYAACRGD